MKTMLNTLTGMVIGAVLTIGATVAGTAAPVTAQMTTVGLESEWGQPTPRWLKRPCENEDSPNCYWDATKQGNGRGHSFYSIRIGRRLCTVYWENRYAKQHNYCTRD